MKKTIRIIVICLMAILFIKYSYTEDIMDDDNTAKTVTANKVVDTNKDGQITSGISSMIYPNISDYKSMTPYNVEEEKEILTGWTTSNLNVRADKTIESNVISVIPFNSYIQYTKEDDGWGKLVDDTQESYIYLKFVNNQQCDYVEYSVPNNNGFKSYMSYKSIRSKPSFQYLIQNYYAYTGNYGIRQVKDRYCVAIGTAFNANVGTYVDLILDNGEIINCIVSDIKADIHTDVYNIATRHNGCVSEFIVDEQYLPYIVHNKNQTGSGNISDCNEMWSGKVTNIKVYDKNLFDE